jgi:two-component system nitrogen regulation sensor histidine kinase GlnL
MTQHSFPGLDILATAVIMLDDAFKVVYANPAAENLFELPNRNFLGRRIEEIFHNAEPLLAAMRAAFAQHASFIEHGLVLGVSGRPKHYLTCTVSPADGKQARLIVEFQPMDQQRRIAREERLLDQTQANRELLRSLAHEIKNPLGGIRGAAQLLEHELQRPDLAEYTQVIVKEADRLQSLMDRLLTPQKPPQRAALNIHEVLERVRSLILAEFPQGITIRRNYDSSLPALTGDFEQLIQAFLNVARNAAQALQGKGDIVFRTRIARQVTLARRRHRLALKISVIDNGPGVPEAIREHVFYPLVSGRDDGTGLGLTLAQAVVLQHQGIIECESAPGRTCFIILLPVLDRK